MKKKTRRKLPMKCETDITRVKKLSARKEGENWRFRSFLKDADLSTEELDAIVHRHYEAVLKQIDCRQCANCCRDASPILLTPDLKRLSSGLNISKKELIAKYLVADEDAGSYRFNKMPCPFLEGNDCSVYEHRPEDCRSYPHLHKEEFVFRLIQAVVNCSICPIVFNVFERLKDELWDDTEDTWVKEE